MLALILSLTRKETGWLWQNPQLGDGLRPVPGLVTQADIDETRADWSGACERMHHHAAVRAGEVRRLSRVHRDPFEPILAVLDTDSPIGTTAESPARCFPACPTPVDIRWRQPRRRADS